MEIKSLLEDRRINAKNALIEITFEEYLAKAKQILNNNEFQRRRVKSSSSVYSLLKQDINAGCIIPPIVLAISEVTISHGDSYEKIVEEINEHANKLLILDGLQRTNSIIDLEKELIKNGEDELLKQLYSSKLRLEIYFGINKLGILYRMLTLNTGQTPMSARHQIEILYSDMLDKDFEGIRLITEIDDMRPINFNEYSFKDVIEGFNSYLDRSELTIDRFDILDNIKSLEKLSKENQENDLFVDFIVTLHQFNKKISELADGWVFDDSSLEQELNGLPFGKSVDKIFKKSQSITGFGAAVGKLFDFGIITSFSDIQSTIRSITFRNNPEEGLNSLILKLDKIRLYAKKIGNDQRLLFMLFFKELFDTKGDAYGVIDMAIDEAFNSYIRKTQ